MNKLNKLLITFLILIPFLTGAQTLKEDLKAKTIVIATDGLYPPFEFVNDQGVLDGFETQLLIRACEIAHLKCEFKWLDDKGENLQFGSLIPGVLNGEWDITFGDMGITTDRINMGLKFVRSHSPAKFFLGKLNDKITRIPDDLSGKKVGVEKNTKFSEYIHYLDKELKQKNLPPISIVEYENSNDLKEALLTGEIQFNPAPEAFIIVTAKDKKFEGFGVASPELVTNFGGEILGREGAGFAFKNSSILSYRIEAAMQELLYSCEYKEIYDKYIGPEVTNLYVPKHCKGN